METKYISSITLPNGDVAQIMDKTSGYTTNTGTITDVKVGTTSSNASSVVSSGVATLLVNTAYNASSNKIATMSDVAAATSGISDVKINDNSIVSSGIANFNTNTAYNSSSNKIATMSDIPSASTSAPSAVGTTASAGSATTWSKSDHVHNITSSTITSALGYTPPSDDTKVKLTSVTSGSEYPIVLGPSSITSGNAYEGNYNSDVTINPNSKQISLKQIKLSYNADSYATIKVNGYNGTSTNNTPKVQIQSYRANTSGGSDYNVLLQNIATPSANTDAANKKYVDDSVSGLGSGTVTSVGLSNASGETDFTIASTPITGSGTITITHANSVTAQSTKAVYPISFDKHGHITGSNNAVTILTTSDVATIINGDTTLFRENSYNSSASTNLNSLTNPGTYEIYSTSTYTNMPFSFTEGLLFVLNGGDNLIIQKFEQPSIGSSNIDAVRYSTDGGSTWGEWFYDNGMGAYISWSTGTHDANSPIIGTVWCRSGSSYVSNLPGSATYGFLVTTGRITTTGVQMLHQTYTEYSSSGTTGFYIRYYANSQWYPWVLIGPGGGAQYNNLDEVSF